MKLHYSLLTLGIAAVSFGLQAQAVAATNIPVFRDYTSALGGTTQVHHWSHFDSNTPVAAIVNEEGSPSPVTFAASHASRWFDHPILSPSGAAFAPWNDESNAERATYFFPSNFGGGIYSNNSTTLFQTTVTSPVAGMQSLIVSIGMNESASGDISAINLVLNHSGGQDTLFSSTFFEKGSLIVDSEGAPVQVAGVIMQYQFDLSPFEDITAYDFIWQVTTHKNTYGIHITESTAEAHDMVLIPEPSTYALMAAGIAGVAFLRRRRANRAA